MKVLILCALASTLSIAKVTAKKGWIRQMPPSSDVTAGFVTFENDSEALHIVSVKADFAKDIELHTHVIDEGIMQMRKVEKMEIPKNGKLILKPHGKHIMFFGVKGPLKAGDEKKLEFKLSNGEVLKTRFHVKGLKKSE